MTESLKIKVARAVKLIRSAAKIAAENGCPEIAVAYSGGKDSAVILELTKMSGVPYRAIHFVTTVDPAGTIKNAMDNGCEINRPKMSFLDIIKKKGFPSRLNRFCCQILKERYVADYILLGIRADESTKRRQRYKEPEQCRVYNKKESCRQYFPILDWTKEDVLAFVEERGVELHPLYYKEDGTIDIKRRLGCMCCPMASQKQRLREFKAHPNMVKLYVRGGGSFLVSRQPHNKILKYCKDPYELFCFDVFCDRNYARFQEQFGGHNLFSAKIDCKMFLEEYFKIMFNTKDYQQ